jgi:hypothetical protein
MPVTRGQRLVFGMSKIRSKNTMGQEVSERLLKIALFCSVSPHLQLGVITMMVMGHEALVDVPAGRATSIAH